MRFLDNLSIGPKTLLVPVFLMVVIIAMGIATVLTLESEKETLNNLRVEAYERRSDALTLSDALNEAHGSLFRPPLFPNFAKRPVICLPNWPRLPNVWQKSAAMNLPPPTTPI